MKERDKNILTIVLIISITLLTMLILQLIPNYLREMQPDDPIGFKPTFIIIFLLFDIIFISIPFWIHRAYTKDYTKLKSIWFFALFGGITGALLGEGGNLVMIIPYTILMLIYALLYKRFTWWKVALTSYLGGIIVENALNRSPLQVPTLMWIAFFTYPYFVTKIFENRKKIKISKIFYDFKWSFVFSIILILLAILITRNNISPPLILLGAVLPFIISIIYKAIKKRK